MHARPLRSSRGQARGLSFEQAVVLLLELVGNLDRDCLEGTSVATGDWYHELDDPDDRCQRERSWLLLWCCEQLTACAVAALTLALVVTLLIDEHQRGRGHSQAALEEVQAMLTDEIAMA